MNEPNINEEAVRLQHLENIKQAGQNPYPALCERIQTLAEAKAKKTGVAVQVAGRLVAKREMGKLCFGHLKDFSGRLQVAFSEKELGKEDYKFFAKNIDLGDFLGVSGEMFITHKGEISILVKKYQLISKALLPLPEKFHGLADVEIRYRKRYLDLLANEESMAIAKTRSLLVKEIRNYFDGHGFFEVETPVLQTLYGGANAQPFITKHNALGMQLYLRIAPELYLKRLVVGGFEKVYEVAKCFRNEGIDNNHNPEFTQIEFYWAYANHEDGMKLVQEMYKKIAKEVFGTTKFENNGHKFDLADEWKIYDFEKIIKKYTGMDIYEASVEDLINKLIKLKVEYEDTASKWRLVDVLWKYCRKNLAGPGFLVGQPVEVSPLAKRMIDDKRKVEQFQVIIAGSEVGNGYSELNDPIDQEKRFEHQMEMKNAGDSEAQDHDKDFVEALKYGMPPTCGFGVSERLFGFLVGKPLRECVIFPLMRPKDGKKGKK